MKKLLFGAVGLIGASFIGYALAQTYPPAQVPGVNGVKDVVQVIPGGVQGTVPSVYAPAGLAGQTYNYGYTVPTTGFQIIEGNQVTFRYLNPAATLATGSLVLPTSPGDGQRYCLEDSVTQTAFTISAPTGSSLATFGGAALTALTANTQYCWFYIASQTAWVRTQ